MVAVILIARLRLSVHRVIAVLVIKVRLIRGKRQERVGRVEKLHVGPGADFLDGLVLVELAMDHTHRELAVIELVVAKVLQHRGVLTDRG